MGMDGNNVFMFPAGFVYAFGISFISVERKEWIHNTKKTPPGHKRAVLSKNFYWQ